jgi:glycosyltransferase involved in cell wall biosynthesis
VNILFVCYETPTPVDAGSQRVIHSIKHLAEKYGHDITLVAFRFPGIEYGDLSRYCHVETVDVARRPGFASPMSVIYALGQVLHPRNLFSRYPAFLNLSYSAKMARKVKELIDNNKFDIMALDAPQVIFCTNERLPAVLLETFAMSEIAQHLYRLEKNRIKKLIRLFYYCQTKNYARAYRNFNICVAVSDHQRDMVRAHDPSLDITVIPHGIDTDYLHAVEDEAESPTLVITGSMGGLRNESAVLDFYHETFPMIKARVPEVKLYIVGRNPSNRILSLTEDNSVIVTGYVEDLRPHLSRAWVVVAPLQEGFGVKIRVLQAMAVGKAVVATSLVGMGIDVSPGENIVLADSPQDFADRVIELLNDKELRKKIGSRARQLMETEHNWEKLTERLNEVLEKAAKSNPRFEEV